MLMLPVMVKVVPGGVSLEVSVMVTVHVVCPRNVEAWTWGIAIAKKRKAPRDQTETFVFNYVPPYLI